jgi:A/G-specific adenine glycosylase
MWVSIRSQEGRPVTAVLDKIEKRAGESGKPIFRSLLRWYDAERRDLPWRSAPGETADPYRVWLSEIMLQQTTVKAVAPFYAKFLRRWPTVDALAKAPLDDVLAVWSGLGYYSRARYLHRAANMVVDRFGGAFPQSVELLRELPGVGPYTAAAIASIAFGLKATPVDGNVERVVARLWAVTTALPGAKPELRRLAEELTPDKRAGDFAQAMMDLGATICSPKRPSCMICPLQNDCEAHRQGIASVLPRRTAKGERPVRRGVAFLALREDSHVLLRKRVEAGLLAGMMEVPTTEWSEDWVGADEALRLTPVRADWWPVPGMVSHTFTHFHLELLVYRALVPASSHLNLWAAPERCKWVARKDLRRQALPSLFRKVIAHALV